MVCLCPCSCSAPFADPYVSLSCSHCPCHVIRPVSVVRKNEPSGAAGPSAVDNGGTQHLPHSASAPLNALSQNRKSTTASRGSQAGTQQLLTGQHVRIHHAPQRSAVPGSTLAAQPIPGSTGVPGTAAGTASSSNLGKPLWGSRGGLSTMSSSSLGMLEDQAVQRDPAGSTAVAHTPWWQYMGLLPGLSMVTVLHAAASGCQVSGFATSVHV
jgi:hypothetical protein